jgi:hypothetical protein
VAPPIRPSTRDTPPEVDYEGPTLDLVIRVQLSLGTFDSRAGRDQHQQDHAHPEQYVRRNVIDGQEQPADHQTEQAKQQSSDQNAACRAGTHRNDSNPAGRHLSAALGYFQQRRLTGSP